MVRSFFLLDFFIFIFEIKVYFLNLFFSTGVSNKQTYVMWKKNIFNIICQEIKYFTGILKNHTYTDMMS